MNNSESVNRFQKLLKLRALFKSVSQLSWNVAQIEKRYPIDTLSEEKVSQLLTAYGSFAKELERVDDELKRELENEKEK